MYAIRSYYAFLVQDVPKTYVEAGIVITPNVSAIYDVGKERSQCGEAQAADRRADPMARRRDARSADALPRVQLLERAAPTQPWRGRNNFVQHTLYEVIRGWRFVQVFTQIGEGLIGPDHYEVIFEKEIENN